MFFNLMQARSVILACVCRILRALQLFCG